MVAAAASSISAPSVLLRCTRCIAPSVVELFHLFRRRVAAALEEVGVLHVGADVLSIELEQRAPVTTAARNCQVLRPLAGEGHARDLVALRIAGHAPLAVLVLVVAAAVGVRQRWRSVAEVSWSTRGSAGQSMSLLTASAAGGVLSGLKNCSRGP